MCLEDRSYPVMVYDGHVSAVHMMVRLNCTGCLGYTVKRPRDQARYHCSSFQTRSAVAAVAVHTVHWKSLVVQGLDMRLAELEKCSHHWCSNSRLHAAAVAVWNHAVCWQIHVGLAAGMMLVELGLNSHQCLSFARWTSTHNYFGSA